VNHCRYDAGIGSDWVLHRSVHCDIQDRSELLIQIFWGASMFSVLVVYAGRAGIAFPWRGYQFLGRGKTASFLCINFVTLSGLASAAPTIITG
jgi:hypothetical protein